MLLSFFLCAGWTEGEALCTGHLVYNKVYPGQKYIIVGSKVPGVVQGEFSVAQFK